ncbi:hypothetical protein M8Z33_12830 [Streptomyces sp. ZAF1911]|uniref:hypothetical protein n=1 Tax=Streptomyces sp. ZAF1911 TaxID=2944129 RepID=UPI00237B44C1|nr:hypothetical protein [Streptomyces sp. ZAF1911]MDD9377526.1 hypothetical protein [Streptomyces sp. ZAF1911]
MGGVRRVRTAAMATLAALGLVTALPGAAGAAGTPQPVPSYRGAEGAEAVVGKPSTAGAPQLKAGSVYKDSIAPGERYYRISLDDRSSVYVSAVLQPPGSAKVSYSDGLEVEVLNAENRSCPGSPGRAAFGYDPVPLSAVGARVRQEDADCQGAATYYVKVTREAGKDGEQAEWPLELRVQREPELGGGNAPTAAPSVWPSASPTLPGTDPARRTGGTGFNDARALDTGVWSDELRPGQTRFYRVPLDWGQQLGLAAELSAGKLTKDSGYAPSGLTVSLYSPYRSLVDDKDATYDGKQAGLTLPRTPPVAYENRFSTDRKVGAVRVAGWYYVAVTMAGKVGEFTQDAVPVPLTLRTEVIGTPGKAPAYAEDLAGAGFGVAAQDRTAAKEGSTAVEADAAAANRSVMRVVAGAGFGTGTLLLLVLGGWILLARRRTP